MLKLVPAAITVSEQPCSANHVKQLALLPPLVHVVEVSPREIN